MAAPMRHACRCLRQTVTSGHKKRKLKDNFRLSYFAKRNHMRTVLGIETSCDDTGAAIVDERGNILGDALNSQTKIHVEAGGIIPPVAQALHRENIEHVVGEAFNSAQMTIDDVDAVAVTVKPGLALSLGIGLDYAKALVKESGKPMIPIHHMEAHALTARMLDRIEFPFLVFLMSGGHCLLAVARDIDDFLLLGTSLDDSPGDAFDKTARELRLKDLPRCRGLSGGAAVEMLALDGDPSIIEFPHVLSHIPSCDFSFSGLKNHVKVFINKEKKRLYLSDGDIVPNVADICASFQYGVLRHLVKRLQRAILFCDLRNLIPKENRVLVVSGGVASNQFIRSGLLTVCDTYSLQLVCPPPHLCTDNGIMIAWNGMEKLLSGRNYMAADPQSVRFTPKCPLGENVSDEVQAAGIKLPRLKLLS